MQEKIAQADKTQRLIDHYDGIPFVEVYQETSQYISKAFRDEMVERAEISNNQWKNYKVGRTEVPVEIRRIYIQLVALYAPNFTPYQKEVSHV